MLEKNELSTQDIINFINSGDLDKQEFIVNSIKKLIFSDNKIHIWLLAKILKSKVENGNLNDFEDALFAQINNFSESDFKFFYNYFLNYYKNGNTDKIIYLFCNFR